MKIIVSLLLISILTKAIATVGEYEPERAKQFWNYCLASYCTESQIVGWDVPPMSVDYPGMIDVRVVYNSSDNTQAFLSFHPEETAVYLVFRGTQGTSIENWISNLDAFKVAYPNCNNCEVHQGFYNSYLYLKDSIFLHLKDMYLKYNKPKIRLTGHSLGGALATHAAVDVIKSFGPLDYFYTFGSPRVGNEAFATWWNSLVGTLFVARVTHNCDPVPHLPLKVMGFLHVNTEVYYPSNNVTDWKVCQSNIEDSSCCNQHVFDVNITDHLTYLEEDPSKYKNKCQNQFLGKFSY